MVWVYLIINYATCSRLMAAIYIIPFEPSQPGWMKSKGKGQPSAGADFCPFSSLPWVWGRPLHSWVRWHNAPHGLVIPFSYHPKRNCTTYHLSRVFSGWYFLCFGGGGSGRVLEARSPETPVAGPRFSCQVEGTILG